MTKIFISHSNKDTDFALQLSQALVDKGVEVWIDKSDIHASEKWNDAIQRGLKECEVMILVITPDSMASKNVGDEWLYYYRRSKKIFTILLKPTDDIHFQLEPIQYVDFHQQDFSAAFEHLSAELKRNGIEFSDSEGELHLIGSNKGVETPLNENDNPSVAFGRRLAERVLSKKSQANLNEVKNILPPPFELIEIPGGSVRLGDASADGGTKGGIFEIPDFTIAKYPITNAQYQVFVDAPDGYSKLQWWDYSQVAEEWHIQNAQPLHRTFGGVGDHPRANLSWHEAVAFCRWLTSNLLPLQITLPTEQQWQRAAIGDTSWKYPWGDTFDAEKCNTSESEIMSPTPVTRYLEGASLYGVMDMVGNIGEWCLNDALTGDTDIRKDAELRSIRSVSFRANQQYARPNSRFSNNLQSRYQLVGFRVVLSASSP